MATLIPSSLLGFQLDTQGARLFLPAGDPPVTGRLALWHPSEKHGRALLLRWSLLLGLSFLFFNRRVYLEFTLVFATSFTTAVFSSVL